MKIIDVTDGDLWTRIKPFALPDIARLAEGTSIGVSSVESGSPSPHALSSSHHSGQLADSQAPQFLLRDGSRSLQGNLSVDSGITIDGVDLSVHAADASAHHAPVTVGNTGVSLSGQQISLALAATSGLAISSGLLVGAGDGIDVTADSVAVDVTDIIDTGYGLTEDTNNIRVNLAGTSGLNFASGALRVGAGDGIDVLSSTIAVDVTDILGFALTESSNNIDIDVTTGFTDANRWTAEHEFNVGIRTADIYSDSDLTLQPSDDLWLSPANQVLAANAQELRAETHLDLWAGITGWRIWEVATNYNQLTIGKIKADELAVRVFVADETRVDRGEELWSKSYGIIAEDFDLPADEADVYVYFENAPGLGDASLFSVGDWLLCQTIDWGTGLYISRVWFQTIAQAVSDTWVISTAYTVGQIKRNGGDIYRCIVAHTSSASNEPGVGGSWQTYWELLNWQLWQIRRKYGGTTGDTVLAGGLMVDVGQSGQGWVHLSALEDAGGPYIQMGDWTGDPSGVDIINSFNVYTRIGNLNGLADYSGDTYGFAAGKNLDSATESDWQGVYIDQTNGVRVFNAVLSMHDGGYRTARLAADGSITLGKVAGAHVAYNTGSFYFDGSTGTLRVGDYSGPRMRWNGTDLNLYDADLSFNDGSYDRGVIESGGSLYFGASASANVNTTNARLYFNATNGDIRIGNAAGQNVTWDQGTGVLTVTGAVAIQSSSSGYANLTDVPTQLSDINAGEGSKLSGIAPGATVGATWGADLNSIPARFGDSESAAGLYLTATDMGYYNGATWDMYMRNDGTFRFGPLAGDRITFDGATLNVVGTIAVQSGSSGLGNLGGDLDDISDGSTYGRINQTIITGGYVQTGSGTKDSSLNGWNVGVSEIVGQASGVDQVVLNTSGQITAGGGAVTLDVDGVSLSTSYTTLPDAEKMAWTQSGNVIGSLGVYRDLEAGTGYNLAYGSLETGGDGTYYGYIDLMCWNAAGTINKGVSITYDQVDIIGSAYASVDIGASGDLLLATNNTSSLMQKDSGGTYRNLLYMNSGNELIVGAGVPTGSQTHLYADAAAVVKVDNDFVQALQPLLVSGGDTITGNPYGAGTTNTGWKLSLYSTSYAIGMHSNQILTKANGWLAHFDATNPAGDASTSAPDSNACFAVDGNYIYAAGDLGEAWSSPTPSSPFANYGGSNYDLQYKKFGDMVALRGTLSTSSGSGDGSTIFTLPTGYRPTTTASIPVLCSPDEGNEVWEIGFITISTGGVVTFYGDANSFVNLGGAVFFTS